MGASHPLLSGVLPEHAEPGRAVCYAFRVDSYAVLNMFPLRARHILTNVAGVAAPFQGRLGPSTLEGGTPAPCLMCILGPSGAGAHHPVQGLHLGQTRHKHSECARGKSRSFPMRRSWGGPFAEPLTHADRECAQCRQIFRRP